MHTKDACQWVSNFYVLTQAHENYVEAQLNETTVILHQLEEHKKKLEARNALLEKISYLNAKVSALPDQVSVK